MSRPSGDLPFLTNVTVPDRELKNELLKAVEQKKMLEAEFRWVYPLWYWVLLAGIHKHVESLVVGLSKNLHQRRKSLSVTGVAL